MSFVSDHVISRLMAFEVQPSTAKASTSSVNIWHFISNLVKHLECLKPRFEIVCSEVTMIKTELIQTKGKRNAKNVKTHRLTFTVLFDQVHQLLVFPFFFWKRHHFSFTSMRVQPLRGLRPRLEKTPFDSRHQDTFAWDKQHQDSWPCC